MVEQKLDLFETLVRFLAVKPIAFDEFDLEQARSIIKKERKGAITFVGSHENFEAIIYDTAKELIKSCIKGGTIYLYVEGEGCINRMRGNLIGILSCVNSVVIFGDASKWGIDDPKIKYVSPEFLFTENHQRFFIFQSASFNTALIARSGVNDNQIESAFTNASDAVSLLGQTVGLHIYHQHKEV